MLWSAQEILDGQHQRVDIPAHARTAHNGLLQKTQEGNLCGIICHVPSTTQLVNGLDWIMLSRFQVGDIAEVSAGTSAIWILKHTDCTNHGRNNYGTLLPKEADPWISTSCQPQDHLGTTLRKDQAKNSGLATAINHLPLCCKCNWVVLWREGKVICVSSIFLAVPFRGDILATRTTTKASEHAHTHSDTHMRKYTQRIWMH